MKLFLAKDIQLKKVKARALPFESVASQILLSLLVLITLLVIISSVTGMP